MKDLHPFVEFLTASARSTRFLNWSAGVRSPISGCVVQPPTVLFVKRLRAAVRSVTAGEYSNIVSMLPGSSYDARRRVQRKSAASDPSPSRLSIPLLAMKARPATQNGVHTVGTRIRGVAGARLLVLRLGDQLRYARGRIHGLNQHDHVGIQDHAVRRMPFLAAFNPRCSRPVSSPGSACSVRRKHPAAREKVFRGLQAARNRQNRS
jgi:hypothetical protein